MVTLTNEQVEHVGTVFVESDADEIYALLFKQFFITLILNAIKTTLVCGFILVVFHESINRRIFRIAKYLREFNPRHPAKPLEVGHNVWLMEKGDELDWLGEETNKISSNVHLLYRSIKQEQERLSDFAHVSSDWLWETDELGTLRYCSDSMASALDIDVFSHPLLLDLPVFSNEKIFRTQLLKQQSFQQVEIPITYDGFEHFKIFQGYARFEKNKFMGFRGSAIDITEIKNSQIELENLNQELERKVAERTLDLNEKVEQLTRAQEQLIESEKLAALGGLVAGVAHEVNTPLGISVTATSILKDSLDSLSKHFDADTLTSDHFARQLESMHQSTDLLENNLNRAAKLVQDFKQTAVDQVSEARCEFNVNQVLSALIASLHPETRKVPVAPTVSGDPSVVVYSLPGVLTQVVSNLVLNSVNHAFSDVRSPSIQVHYYLQDDNLVIEYMDNGIGVKQENHKRIFEPFYTTKRGKGGSGLGLNLVFNLVTQKLDGELKFDSKLGQGVHFTLVLPCHLSQ